MIGISEVMMDIMKSVRAKTEKGIVFSRSVFSAWYLLTYRSGLLAA